MVLDMRRLLPILTKLLKAVALMVAAPVLVHIYVSVNNTDKPYLDLTCSDKIMNIRERFNWADNDGVGSTSQRRTYLVNWHDIPFFMKHRPKALNKTFEGCEYSNCEISLSRPDVCRSDAVIFKGRYLPTLSRKFTRPTNQVWIFAEEESPNTYDLDSEQWKLPGYRNMFNWTMTYDRGNADIYLPYGEFRKRTQHGYPPDDERDFLKIAKSKTKDAIIIVSNCIADSKRLEYVMELQKYISVDVLGDCGKPWDCGKRWIYDETCFSILNTTYRFYLSFENTFCRGYRSEKLYQNFNFDLLLVARGDMTYLDQDVPNLSDVIIPTSDFTSVEALGKYLKSLSASPEKYAEKLREKSRYLSVPYENLYQRALCDICKRLNFVDDYKKQISDLMTWSDVDNVCYKPKDVPFLVDKRFWFW